MAQLKDLIVSGIARVVGTLFASTINEGGTNLADKYLGKTAQAADSAKLGGTAASSYATQTWVTGKGYTTNTGTVTSVAIKMNNTVKGTITSSGTIDLGTVITSHQDISGKQDKITTSNKLDSSLVSNFGQKCASEGFVSIVLVGSTQYTTTSGNSTISLPAYPTTLPASDVSAWAKKSSLAASDVPNLSWNKITSDKPTTLSGYGITDAKIANGVITLGGNTITPLTSHQSLAGYATETWVTNKGYTTNVGTVTSVAVQMNGTIKGTITSSGTIDLGNVADESVLADYSKKLDVSHSSSTSANFILNRYTEAPTYQVVSMSSSTSTWKIYNTVPSGKEVVYGYPRYVRITNSTSATHTVSINFNVVCGAKTFSLAAGKSVEVCILEPASGVTPTAKWSQADL